MTPPTGTRGAIDPAARAVISAAATQHAGVVRDAAGLAELSGTLGRAPRLGPGAVLDAATVETTALQTVATLLTTAAGARTESRGCHRRLDAPETRPEWRVRLVHRLDRAGHLHTRTEPVRAPAAALVVA